MLSGLRIVYRPILNQWSRPVSTSLVRHKEDLTKSLNLNEPEQLSTDDLLKSKKTSGYITITKEPDLSPITGIRADMIKDRRVRIYQPSKNAMQSGTHNIGHWQTDFDTKERWENPLMGWTSTGDPLSNLKNEFRTKEEAIAFCEKNGLKWYVQTNKSVKPERVKNYGVNFAWNKRTRVSTK